MLQLSILSPHKKLL